MDRLLLVVVALFTVCAATSPPDERLTAPPLPVKPLEPLPALCSPPFWHGKLGDNWPLAGVSDRSKPKFYLIVKGIGVNNTYRERRPHNIILHVKKPGRKGAKRMHGFILTFKPEDPACGNGKFWVREGTRSTPATVTAGCDFMALDGSTDIIKTRGIKWRAPKCGCVLITAEIRTSDNMLYSDDPDSDLADEYKVLTKRLCHP